MYTLKLDAAWRPIEVIDAYRGFNMAYSGRASVVEHHDDGPSPKHQFPSVIVLKTHISRRKFNLSCTRKNVFYPLLIPIHYMNRILKSIRSF